MAVSQSGRSMSPFTTCWNMGRGCEGQGASLGSTPPHTPSPNRGGGGPHLMHQPVPRHDHQRIPAPQLLNPHQLPGVVPMLCGDRGWPRGI